VVLSSCGKTSTTTNVTQTTTQTTTQTGTQSTTTTAVKTTTTTTAAPIEPQYGGTLNFIGYRTAQPPTTWDLVIGNTNTDYWSDPYTEFLLTADIAGQGPRGTNAFNFQMQETIPAKYLTGQLAETWEQPDALTLIFHIRHGVMWAGNAKIGMAPREFTAKDAEFSLNRYWQSPNGGANMYYLDSITADGNYTLNVKFKSYNPDWYYRIAYGIKCGFVPPEVAAAGAADWRNQVGTGPFIISDYVAGSYATYKKNPN
jgi:peptide/nickel transport system substrate-binding protein